MGRGRQRSVVPHVFEAQLRGSGRNDLLRLPGSLYNRIQSSSQGMAGMCMELEQKWLENDLEACRSAVLRILRSIGLSDGPSARQQTSREFFVHCGGDVLFTRILCTTFDVRKASRATKSNRSDAAGLSGAHGDQEADEARRTADGAAPADVAVSRTVGRSRSRTFRPGLLIMWNECLAVLRELCFSMPAFSESLSSQKHFVYRLFELMENRTTFDHGEGGVGVAFPGGVVLSLVVPSSPEEVWLTIGLLTHFLKLFVVQPAAWQRSCLLSGKRPST